ncbi:ABC transporter permease [Thioclava indica]|uniref:ABC transmembrane type-1 domain-containing protein n=1 Tax=Thioclava indica TaxID=1353528 RepID=A0A074JPQ8_9RHOB|nr:ABC transporter permease subunit [Thioclava indica]KEO51367.1 hypothetical protein DT23_08770 [Thioclava indica]
MNTRESRWRKPALGLAGLVGFVLLWKAVQGFGIAPSGTMPDPFALPGALMDELDSGRLMPAVGASLIHYVWGLTLGSVAGFAVGFAAAVNPTFDGLQSWLARILRPIPPLAWVVFAIAWFKVSHAGAAFVISIGVFWVNYFATCSAVKNIDPRFFELARAFNQDSFWKMHRSVTLPAAAPQILSGLRTGVGQAWMTLIAAELLGVPGMGQEMNAAAGVGAYDAVVVYMLAISAVYTVSDWVFSAVEGRVLQWRPQ